MELAFCTWLTFNIEKNYLKENILLLIIIIDLSYKHAMFQLISTDEFISFYCIPVCVLLINVNLSDDLIDLMLSDITSFMS